MKHVSLRTTFTNNFIILFKEGSVCYSILTNKLKQNTFVITYETISIRVLIFTNLKALFLFQLCHEKNAELTLPFPGAILDVPLNAFCIFANFLVVDTHFSLDFIKFFFFSSSSIA